MITLASIIERFEADYLAQYQSTMLPSQRKALAAMKLCRSSMAPRMLAQCSACDEQRLVPHSCGHRNCPHCQHFESQRWIERQTQALVAGSYFLITFTLPSELRPLAWRMRSGNTYGVTDGNAVNGSGAGGIRLGGWQFCLVVASYAAARSRGLCSAALAGAQTRP